jgi:hypothetical protein
MIEHLPIKSEALSSTPVMAKMRINVEGNYNKSNPIKVLTVILEHSTLSN